MQKSLKIEQLPRKYLKFKLETVSNLDFELKTIKESLYFKM